VRTVGLKVIGGALCVLVLTADVPSSGARAVSPQKALAVSYSMPKRFGLDRNKDRLIDYQDTVAEVRPVVWPVDFRIAGCARAASFRWTVNGRPAAFASTGRCTWRHTFRREGSYTVRVREAGPKGARAGGADVVVQDWLLVGLGDSVGSGEGVPDVAGRGGTWQDRGCHRSASSFQALAARRLEDGDAKTSVTFVHLACSGATVGDVLGQQLDTVRRLVGSREIDAVLASVGANDLRFGPVVLFCVTQHDCPTSVWGGVPGGPTLGQLMPAWVSELNGRYGPLAAALRAVTRPSRTYITEYFDPLHAAGGALCTQSVDVGSQRLEVTAAEAQWLLDNFLVPLNREVNRAAAARGWSFVSGAQEQFGSHGYCAAEPWVVRYEESLLSQGDANGTLHPNRRGHAALAELVLAALRRDLYPDGRARRPG
jgi:lysophospholipase L1-like esterase